MSRPGSRVVHPTGVTATLFQLVLVESGTHPCTRTGDPAAPCAWIGSSSQVESFSEHTRRMTQVSGLAVEPGPARERPMADPERSSGLQEALPGKATNPGTPCSLSPLATARPSPFLSHGHCWDAHHNTQPLHWCAVAVCTRHMAARSTQSDLALFFPTIQPTLVSCQCPLSHLGLLLASSDPSRVTQTSEHVPLPAAYLTLPRSGHPA